jgi:hypothetical protein
MFSKHNTETNSKNYYNGHSSKFNTETLSTNTTALEYLRKV